MLITIIVNIILLILAIVMYAGVAGISYMINCPTMLIILAVFISTIWGTGYRKDFWNAIKISCNKKKSYSLIELKRAEAALKLGIQIAILTGGILFLIGSLCLLRILSDPANLGPMIAILLISILYALLLAFIFVPMRAKINQRIIAYMEEPALAEALEDVSGEQQVYYLLRAKGLTDRESEVSRLVSQGMSNREIAGKLFISETTVKKHITHILEKMEMENREMLSEFIAENRK